MIGNDRSKPDATVFIKLLDRGFRLSVPADHEKYYRDGYEVFMKRVAIHKKEGGHYDDLEAIALTSIECLVALQKAQEQLESLIAALEERADHIDSSVSRALEK